MSPRKQGLFAGNPDGARQYLANLAAAGLWTPQKSLDAYKDAQVTRKANAFKQQEQAGVPVSNKAARGHADIIPQRSLVATGSRTGGPSGGTASGSPRRQRKDVAIIPPPKLPMDRRITGVRGSSQFNTTKFALVLKELKHVERSKPEAKVYFRLWDNRTGDWKKLYVYKGAFNSPENGVSLKELMERVKEKIKSGQAKTERQALLQVWQEDIEGKVAGEDTPDDVTMPEVFSVISVHVMAG